MNSSVKELIIDSKNADARCSGKFRGFGITAESRFSKLMMDYKFNAPESHNEIMELLFKPGYGAGISHIKIEQKTDNALENPDESEIGVLCEEEISFLVAAEALKINPDITIEFKLLKSYISSDIKYSFIKRFIDSVYSKFGIMLDFISFDADDSEYVHVLDFFHKLRNENNPEYDYSQIKIILCDDIKFSGTSKLAESEELRKAVNIIEIKSPVSDENLELLSKKFSMEIWYNESSVELISSETLSCCLSAMCRNGIPVTLCCINPQNLIKADEPWSGFYEIEVGFWKLAHISWFVKRNCKLVLAGGSDDTEKYAAFISDDDTYAIIAENFSDETKRYNICVRNIAESDSDVYSIETKRAEEAERYDLHWFRVSDKIIPARNKSGWFYRVDVKPHSVVTCTTAEIENVDGTDSVKKCSFTHRPLLLPYADDFDYTAEQLEACGKNPFYSETIRGRFTICRYGNENVLQHISATNEFSDHSSVILIGDSCWNNYSFKSDVLFGNTETDNYAGIGVRCFKNTLNDVCGYQFRIYCDGRWQLWNADRIETEGKDENLDPEKWNVLRMSANHNRIRCFLNKQLICEYIAAVPVIPAGCVALYSANYTNRFKDLSVSPVIGAPEYSIKRKIPESSCSEYEFTGETVALVGDAENLRLKIEIDGRIMTAGLYIDKCSGKQAFYYKTGLSVKEHTIKITALSGTLILREIIADDVDNTLLKSIGVESKPGKNKEKGKIRKSTLLVGAGLAAAGAGAIIFKKLHKKRK